MHPFLFGVWIILSFFSPVQKYYMASSRELVRIVSIQKSPIINLFGESIAGASTIRGFGQEKRFMKRNLYLLDCFARPFFCSLAAIEWLCLRMELLSTFVFAFCMALLVSFPHGSIDPSMHFWITICLKDLICLCSYNPLWSFYMDKNDGQCCFCF